MQKPTKALIAHLRAKLRAAEPYYCMKLLIIGQADHGKTTLMYRLKGDNNFNGNLSTQGKDDVINVYVILSSIYLALRGTQVRQTTA